MNTTSKVIIVGQIDGEVDRKTITTKRGEAAVAEFYIEGIGLRCSAWDDRAKAVPEEGLLLIGGYLNSRQYEYEGKTRTSTNIRVTDIAVISTAPEAASDDDDLDSLGF